MTAKHPPTHPHPTLLLLTLLLTLTTACTPLTLPPADLTIINGKEPESLDPAIINGQADGRIVNALFEGLTRYNHKTGQPEPGLAQTWTTTPDQKQYHFTLRPNLKWSNGKPITIHHIHYTLQRILNPATACEYANTLYPIHNAQNYHQGNLTNFNQVGIKTKPPNQIHIHLNHPTPYLPHLLAHPALATIPKQTIQQHQDRWLLQPQLPTSGPYQLTHWHINHRIRLTKNPHYWDAKNTQTHTIDLLPITHPTTALNLYHTQQTHIIWDKNLLPTHLIPTLKQHPHTHTTPLLGTYFLRINTQQPPLNNHHIRQALTHAIDKTRLTQRITRAGETPTQTLTPPGIPGYQPPTGLPYNPTLARTLLQQAGYPNGRNFPPLDYLFNTSELNQQIAIEIQAMWQTQLNIKTNLRQLEWKTYLQDQRNLNYHISRSSWIADYQDPQTFLELLTTHNGNNRTGWKNHTYDTLLHNANNAPTTQQRMQQLQQTEQHLLQAAPIIPLYHHISIETYNPNQITGIHPNPLAQHPLRAIRRIHPPTNQ